MSFAARRMGGTPSSTLVISANTANLVITPSQISNYTVGMRIEIVIPSGIWVYSSITTSPGLQIIAFNPSDSITITNLGFIAGKGGVGGSVWDSPLGAGWPLYGGYLYGQNGGPALSAWNAIVVNNTAGFIGGGGGGGGSCGVVAGGLGSVRVGASGGGGAGGGQSGVTAINNLYLDRSAFNAPGHSVSNGSAYRYSPGRESISTGGSGGYSLPGSSFTGSVATYKISGTDSIAGRGAGSGNGGAGGGAAYESYNRILAGGGGGGSWGASGGSGYRFDDAAGTYVAGGDGAYDISNGGNAYSDSGTILSTAAGGAGGKAVDLNGGSGSITWVGGAASSSRAYGAVS